MDVSKKLRR